SELCTRVCVTGELLPTDRVLRIPAAVGGLHQVERRSAEGVDAGQLDRGGARRDIVGTDRLRPRLAGCESPIQSNGGDRSELRGRLSILRICATGNGAIGRSVVGDEAREGTRSGFSERADIAGVVALSITKERRSRTGVQASAGALPGFHTRASIAGHRFGTNE